MAASFVVYIDEAGDEGFKFSQGSSEWFVLSAAITRKRIDLETVKLVDDVRGTIGRVNKKPLHFRELDHEKRLVFIDRISTARIRTVTVMFHKPSISERETFAGRYRMYFYATRYLLERVSWCCRDNREPNDVGDGSAEIAFSNRSGMSYAEMCSYLELLKTQYEIGGSDVRIEWSVIKPSQIKAYPARDRMGLQIADAVATGFLYGLRLLYGFSEDRYARMLKPVVYNYRRQFLGYGIKIWPSLARSELQGKHYNWLREEYDYK